MATKVRVTGIFALAIFLPQLAAAQVVITEIMYDLPSGSDSGREWVEVYNAGASSVKITNLRLFENGTAHKIVASGGGDLLAPVSYAIVVDNPAKFKTDWPNFSGQLFDSTFSLSNTGETISLKNASSTELNSATYTNADGGANGNSLNRNPSGGTFVSRAPSPGAAMSTDTIPPPAPKATAQKVTRTTKAKALSVTEVSDGDEAVSDVALPDLPAEASAQAGSSDTSQTDSPPSGNPYLWYSAAGGLSLLAAGAVFAARQVGKKEWDISEDAGE